MKLQYTFTRQFFLQGLRPRTPAGGPLAPRPPRGGIALPQTPGYKQRGYPPLCTPPYAVEECTYLVGCKYFMGYKHTAESKRPLNHMEDNQAPQPTLYGLKQAPRAWYAKMDSYLLSQNFVHCKSDPNVYMLRKIDPLLLLVLYVDDFLITNCSTSTIVAVKRIIHK
jgi:hypothetical protein